MSHLLVVVEPLERTRDLLEIAAEYARGTDHTLLLFSVTEEDASGETRAKMRRFTNREHAYELSVEGNTEFARDIGEEFLPAEVPFEAAGGIGDPVGRISNVIEEFDCSHIFVAGRKRTPTGKAIFGDTTQRLLLTVDRPVTLILE